ncbi:MAG: sulfotransferase [Proteobacteria bacterium]|nr:sulfotransferase [Pseudomonadota bacterium]
MDMITSPIFLVGAERSGTTLLRLMLDHHTKIAFNYEFEFAVDRITKLGQWPSLTDYYKYLEIHRIFLDSNLSIDKDLDYPNLINSFLLQKQQRDGKEIIGATVHHEFHHLHKIWPEARFIHLIRDGRDVAHSNILMGWAGNMFTGIDRWTTAENIWQNLQTKLQPQQYITVSYEKFIQNPEVGLQEICAFIGVEFDEKMFDYTKSTKYKLPNPKIIGRWRTQFSDYEIQLAESKAASLLTKNNYPLSGLPILSITSGLKLRMYIQNRWKTNMMRMRRYSINLYLQDILSRLLHIESWQKKVRLVINDCDRKNLK